MRQLRVGLFGVGLDAYWSQFEGLHQRLMGYQARVRELLSSFGAQVTDAGLVDSQESSCAAAAQLAASGADLIVLYISTYALSSTVLPIVSRMCKPVLVLNLQPSSRIDYGAINEMDDRGRMTGEWLAHCQACALPEIACVFRRARIPFRVVTGHMEDDRSREEVGQWMLAARVVAGMEDNRVGLLGRYYGGMLDVYSDLTQLSAAFGSHFEILEMDELASLRATVSERQIGAMRERFAETFAVNACCAEADLERAARSSVALHLLVEGHRLGSLAYYYEGREGGEHQDMIISWIAGLTLLTAGGVPCAGEYEVKNVMAMKIMDLAGAGGSFSEFYAMDFDDDVVLLGHDGPGHPAIAAERVRLVPLPVYHGKPGHGLSIQMSVANGPVTLLSVKQDEGGRVGLLVAEAEAVPGPTLQIGNTNTRYRFPLDARQFVNEWSKAGPSHHCAIGRGHHAAWLEKLANLKGLTFTKVG